MPKIDLGFKVVLVSQDAEFFVERCTISTNYATILRTKDAVKTAKAYNAITLEPGESKRIMICESYRYRVIAAEKRQ